MSECPICLEEFRDDDALSKTECGHTFHSKCIFRAITVNINCPSSRTPLFETTSETHNISQGSQDQPSTEYDLNHNNLIRMVNNRLINNNPSATHNTETNNEEDNLILPNFYQGLLNRMMNGESHSNPIDLTNDNEEIRRETVSYEGLGYLPPNSLNVEELNREYDEPISYMNILSSYVLGQLRSEISSLNNTSNSNNLINNEVQHEFRFNRSLRQYISSLPHR